MPVIKTDFTSKHRLLLERLSHDLEMKTREKKRNNKRTEIEWFDWFIERIQTRVAFGWLGERLAEKLHARRAFSKSIDTSLWHTATHYWPIEQCLLHIRVVCGGNTKSPCFDLFIHWLMKQITNTYRTISQGHTKIALFGFWIEKLSVLSRNGPRTGRMWCPFLK